MASASTTARPARSWKLAPVISTLLHEVDQAWPSRATTSDGTIGDARHQKRESDHNPDEHGFVRAWDCTRDPHRGPPLDLLAEFIREVGLSGSQRLALGGYVIYNRKIASDVTRWLWMPYKGEDPHTSHMHVSCSRLPAFYMITRPWHVAEAVAQRRLRRRP